MLDGHGVETLSHTLSHIAVRVAAPLGRLVTIIAGFVITMVGLAMIATIVMLPLGVTLGLLGIAIVLCGVFAPPHSSGG